jgi:hypothetical protein
MHIVSAFVGGSQETPPKAAATQLNLANVFSPTTLHKAVNEQLKSAAPVEEKLKSAAPVDEKNLKDGSLLPINSPRWEKPKGRITFPRNIL